MSWLKDLLTEVDGESFDLKRVAAMTLLLGFHAGSGYDLFVLHNAFNLQQYGIAAGLMVAAIGAALGFGAKAEARVKDADA